MFWFVAAAGGIFYALWKGTVPKAEALERCEPEVSGTDETPSVETLQGRDGSEEPSQEPGEPLPDPETPEELPDPAKPEELPYNPSDNPFTSPERETVEEDLGIDIPDGHKGSMDDILPDIEVDPFEEEFNLEEEPEEEPEEV